MSGVVGQGMDTVHFSLRDSFWISIDDRQIRGVFLIVLGRYRPPILWAGTRFSP